MKKLLPQHDNAFNRGWIAGHLGQPRTAPANEPENFWCDGWDTCAETDLMGRLIAFEKLTYEVSDDAENSE